MSDAIARGMSRHGHSRRGRFVCANAAALSLTLTLPVLLSLPSQPGEMADVGDPLPRPGGYPLPQSTSAECSLPSVSHLRPTLPRRETDLILSYYQSEHAGRPYDHADDDAAPGAVLTRTDSRSSSEYSSESYKDAHSSGLTLAEQPVISTPPPRASHHTRRPSVPTQESVDRRRLAIVELDSELPPSVSRRGSSRIVDSDFGVSYSSSLLLRRGIHVDGLALVAPPDASPSTYTNLTPPPTAPIFPANRHEDHPPSSYAHSRSASDTIGWTHLRRKTSRDVGIVGAIPTITEAVPLSTPQRESCPMYITSAGLQVPIFQTPTKSRTPSPGALTPELSNSSTTSYPDSFFATPTKESSNPNLTPSIGEGKDIQRPVVGPVVVGLDSERVIRQPMQPVNNGAQLSTSPSSYLSYQPGVHSTAGPLPPPPMAVYEPGRPASLSPPPRPPRLRTPGPQATTPLPTPSQGNLEALKESLQLPSSVSSVLESRTRSRPDLTRTNTDTSVYSAQSHSSSSSSGGSRAPKPSDIAADAKRSRSVHRREGAFPPSSSSATSTPASSPQVDIQLSTEKSEVNASPKKKELPIREDDNGGDSPRRGGIELHRERSWISLKESNISSSPNGKPQQLEDTRSSISISRSPSLISPPLPPPKVGKALGEDLRTPSSGSSSSNPFRATLSSLKRFSALPRTPSSLSIGSSKSRSTPKTSRTPSPSPARTPRNRQQRPRIVDPNPAALMYGDIATLKSPVERADAYIQKINDLSMYDSGLREWMAATLHRGNEKAYARNSRTQLVDGPALPSTLQTRAQPRHVSHGSVDSELTFPIRPDAYTAADLTMRPSDDIVLTSPPPVALPYPSLAMNPSTRVNALPSTSSSRTYQVSLSGGRPRSKTGFFASIGRKASLRSPGSPPSTTRVLTKRGPESAPPPRPIQVQVQSAPLVRGGPRALPSRMQRSKTISVALAPSPPQEEEQVYAPPVSVTRSDTMSTSRHSTASRRPSLFHRSMANHAPPPPSSGPDFERQVDKLSDLLPHANRDVLAGYLRRSGQDILAIGQYLEDEKNGKIRYD